jgi:hypothetical protein
MDSIFNAIFDAMFKRVSREVLVALTFYSPEARRIRFECWPRDPDRAATS